MNEKEFRLTPVSTHLGFGMGWGGTNTVEPFDNRLKTVDLYTLRTQCL